MPAMPPKSAPASAPTGPATSPPVAAPPRTPSRVLSSRSAARRSFDIGVRVMPFSRRAVRVAPSRLERLQEMHAGRRLLRRWVPPLALARHKHRRPCVARSTGPRPAPLPGGDPLPELRAAAGTARPYPVPRWPPLGHLRCRERPGRSALRSRVDSQRPSCLQGGAGCRLRQAVVYRYPWTGDQGTRRVA